MSKWKLAQIKETVMCEYDIQGCQYHMDIYVGDYINEQCEDCGATESCYKVIYTSPSIELGFVWKGTKCEQDNYPEDSFGEYFYYPSEDEACEAFEKMVKEASKNDILSFGIAVFDEKDGNRLVPKFVKATHNYKCCC